MQETGSHNNVQTASINNGTFVRVDQLQAAGSFNNTQTVTIDSSRFGNALQFQGAGVSGNAQTITQTGGGTSNQAGQAQGNNNNTAVVNQIGGPNIAVQNQGILPGATGFMSVVGGQVVRH